MFSLPKDNEDMMKLYGSIVERLDDKDRIKRLLQKQNYEEFVEEFIKADIRTAGFSELPIPRFFRFVTVNFHFLFV